MSELNIFTVGDIWHRVDGLWIDDGSEVYCGMELDWTVWRVVKVTRCGAWLQCMTYPYKKQRFAPTHTVRWCSSTKEDALERFIKRKRRQLEILRQETTMTRDALEVAEAALAAGEFPA
jgi:hypothetical protein